MSTRPYNYYYANSNAVALCACRLVLPFVPELNTGRRYQNTYLMTAWLLEIASYINSSFNIFVYYSMGSRYRETMKALFCRGRVTTKSTSTDTEQTSTVSVAVTTARCYCPHNAAVWSFGLLEYAPKC